MMLSKPSLTLLAPAKSVTARFLSALWIPSCGFGLVIGTALHFNTTGRLIDMETSQQAGLRTESIFNLTLLMSLFATRDFSLGRRPNRRGARCVAHSSSDARLASLHRLIWLKLQPSARQHGGAHDDSITGPHRFSEQRHIQYCKRYS